MKKIIIPILIISAVLLTASCGKKKAAPAPSVSPSFVVVTPSATSAPDKAKNAAKESKTDKTDTANTAQSGSISIINGTSEAFYAVHISSSNLGNLGENIIGDSPLGEGEEISLPFENASSDEMTITVEDESGRQYSVGGIYLTNGLSVELRLENGELTAIIQ